MTEIASSSKSTAPDPLAPSSDVILSAVIAAGARFVPVPLVDDVIKGRANRRVVANALEEAGRSVPINYVAPLYDTGGFLTFLASVPLAVLLFPIRRVVAVVSAVKGVPTDFLETVLLSRAVRRHLQASGFRDTKKRLLRREAKEVRRAFDVAFKETSMEAVSAAMGGALAGARGLSEHALARARELVARDSEQVPEDADAIVDAETIRSIDAALRQAEVVERLEAFDKRFDEALAAAG